ncbi:MAG: L-2-hydroxyglutarate oxidase [Solirubrobacteraceae bacterium]|nr:L-2-hydroxyglutarate oxidase [Solirubrobacteraceae bacterium]
MVGAGIVGLAVAREILLRHPGTGVTVLEKEPEVATHQTGRNSGVVHAGLYYPPGSLKATLCRRGVELLRAFTAEHDIAYDECGKLVVALDPSELGRLATIEERSRANGVPVYMLEGAQLQEIEPHVVGLAALHSPTTAIVDYGAVSRALAGEIERLGGRVRTSTEVERVDETHGTIRVVTTGGEELEADRVCVCAGLHADRLARDSGEAPSPRIVPFRGEYWKLRPEKRSLVRGLIYPVPDPSLPFLGVHLTKRIDGEILVGPNAVLALAREGYDWGTIRPKELAELLRWRGTWRLFGAHWRTGIAEMRRSASRGLFVEDARRYVPELQTGDVVRAHAGVRAQAVDPDGSLVDDFRIGQTRRATWVRNAPSPAATASLAIAESLVQRMDLAAA